MKQFHLVVDEAQMQTIINMADLYSRIGTGQLGIVAEQLQMGDVGNPLKTGEHIAGIEALSNSLNQAKYHFFGFSPGASHAIRSEKVPDRFKVAYDIKQVIRYTLCQVDPEQHAGSVWANPPLQASTRNLPTCVLVKNAESRPMPATA